MSFNEPYIKEKTYPHGAIKVNRTSMRLMGFDEDFDLKQTFECGQCFRWEAVNVHENDRHILQKYRGVVKEYLVDVIKYKDGVIDIKLFQGTGEEPLHDMTTCYPFFIEYFDLMTDYQMIKRYLIKKDDTLAPMVVHGAGIRILNQPFEETLYSFIISANNNIKRIKGSIEKIAVQKGDLLGEIAGKNYYSFPGYEVLKDLDKEDFRDLGLGYRDHYIVDAINHMQEGFEQKICKDASFNGVSNEILNETSNGATHGASNYEVSKKMLKSIKGIGDKVADCILLFSLGFRGAFPVDTWMKKMMGRYYQINSVDVMQKYAKTYFAPYGGYAQQYMFYYGLSGQMSKAKKERINQNNDQEKK